VWYNLFVNKEGVTMEEKKCTCGHTKAEHNTVIGSCSHGHDVRKNPCLCQYYSTIIQTHSLFAGVVIEDENEDEDDE
jgi:hypothetical protein